MGRNQQSKGFGIGWYWATNQEGIGLVAARRKANGSELEKQRRAGLNDRENERHMDRKEFRKTV
jgi:hypothetical protein